MTAKRTDFYDPSGKNYAPALCRTCPNYEDFRQEAISEANEKRQMVSESDISLHAMMSCVRGRTRNTNKPCTIQETTAEYSARILARIASKTE